MREQLVQKLRRLMSKWNSDRGKKRVYSNATHSHVYQALCQ